MAEVSFTVHGAAVAQGRPRFTTKGGYAKAYDPAKSKDYKDYVRLAAAQAMGQTAPLERPLIVQLRVVLPLLKSFSKKQRAAAISGSLRPSKKPDVDNFQKCVWDACNNLVWKDDSQIVDARATKVYGEQPQINVSAREL